MADRVITTNSSEQTFIFGKELGTKIKKIVSSGKKGVKIGFKGTLGAGKTLMIKGLMSELCPNENTSSPSFTIVNEYYAHKRRILHADLYRIYRVEELLGTGFLEALNDKESVVLVEWIDHISDRPEEMVLVEIEPTGDNSRKITVKNWSE